MVLMVAFFVIFAFNRVLQSVCAHRSWLLPLPYFVFFVLLIMPTYWAFKGLCSNRRKQRLYQQHPDGLGAESASALLLVAQFSADLEAAGPVPTVTEVEQWRGVPSGPSA